MALGAEQYRKEVICVISSLNTSDPSNIFDTLKTVEEQVRFLLLVDSQSITCSVLSLSGEVFIYKKLAQISGGQFCVPETAFQIQDFFLHHLQPPVSKIDETPIIVPSVKQSSEVQPIGFPPFIESSTVGIETEFDSRPPITALAT